MDRFDCILCPRTGYEVGGPFVAVPEAVSSAKGSRKGGHFAHIKCVLCQPSLFIEWQAASPLCLQPKPARPLPKEAKALGKPSTWGGGRVLGWEAPDNTGPASGVCGVCTLPGGATVKCGVGYTHAPCVLPIPPHAAGSGSALGGISTAAASASAYAGDRTLSSLPLVPWEHPHLAARAKDPLAAKIGNDHGMGHCGAPLQLAYYSCRNPAHPKCAGRSGGAECVEIMHASCAREKGFTDTFVYDDLQRAADPRTGAIAPLRSRFLCNTHTRKFTLIQMQRMAVGGALSGLPFTSLTHAQRAFLVDRDGGGASKHALTIARASEGPNSWWFSIIRKAPTAAAASGVGVGVVLPPPAELQPSKRRRVQLEDAEGAGGRSSSPGLGHSAPDAIPGLATPEAADVDSALQTEAVHAARTCASALTGTHNRLADMGLLPLPLDLACWLPLSVYVYLKAQDGLHTREGSAAGAGKGKGKGRTYGHGYGLGLGSGHGYGYEHSASSINGIVLPQTLRVDRDKWLLRAGKDLETIMCTAFALDAAEQGQDREVQMLLAGARDSGMSSLVSPGTALPLRPASTTTPEREGEGPDGEVSRGSEAASLGKRPRSSSSPATPLLALPAYASETFSRMAADLGIIDGMFAVAEARAAAGSPDAQSKREDAEYALLAYTHHCESVLRPWNARMRELCARASTAHVDLPWPPATKPSNERVLCPLLRAALLRGLGWDWSGQADLPVLPPLLDARVKDVALEAANACIGFSDALAASPATDQAQSVGRQPRVAIPSLQAPCTPQETSQQALLRRTLCQAMKDPRNAQLMVPGGAFGPSQALPTVSLSEGAGGGGGGAAGRVGMDGAADAAQDAPPQPQWRLRANDLLSSITAHMQAVQAPGASSAGGSKAGCGGQSGGPAKQAVTERGSGEAGGEQSWWRPSTWWKG